jgi:predicted enzyme related to lactoylglutathione lyase
MSERDGFQEGVPCWVAAVFPDPEGAVDFYTELFGWEAFNLMPSDHPGDYFLCMLNGRKAAGIVSEHGAPPPPQPVWGTHIWVESADEAVAKATAAGGSVVAETFSSPAGGRMAVLADPTGAVFCVWEPGEHRGAEVVNEPGAWAMSVLNTRDPERSEDFYRAVFGWAPEAMGSNGGPMLMRLPGFVGGEPLQPVPRDVVAVMAPMSGDEFPDEVPSHWSVDFWVKDADETAERAAELGGTVIAPPFDVPGVGMREAVLADPQGAAFSVTRAPGPHD